MNQDEMNKLMIRGLIATLPEAEQKRVTECAEKLKAIIAEYETQGIIALTLIALDLQAQAPA